MIPENTSTLTLLWAIRPGDGGKTERRYRDFVVDGVPLSTVVGDVVSPFGWLIADEQVAAADRLLRRAKPDLPGGRVSLYVCAECGDLGCGAVSVTVEATTGGVLWRDFGFQNNYEDSIHRTGLEAVGPFLFEGRTYLVLLDELKRDAERVGV